jgi:hypothetical protein
MRLVAAAMLVCVLGGSALAQTPLSARESLMAADRNFSKLSDSKGRAHAFLAMAASNARLFGAGDAGAIYGRAQAFRALSRGQNPRMRWEPQAAGVSGDGRMGWTDGRWEIGPRGAAVTSGHYLTVWLKDARGAWKVQANMNTSDPAKK